jgi:hypothetical protein
MASGEKENSEAGILRTRPTRIVKQGASPNRPRRNRQWIHRECPRGAVFGKSSAPSEASLILRSIARSRRLHQKWRRCSPWSQIHGSGEGSCGQRGDSHSTRSTHEIRKLKFSCDNIGATRPFCSAGYCRFSAHPKTWNSRPSSDRRSPTIKRPSLLRRRLGALESSLICYGGARVLLSGAPKLSAGGCRNDRAG